MLTPCSLHPTSRRRPTTRLTVVCALSLALTSFGASAHAAGGEKPQAKKGDLLVLTGARSRSPGVLIVDPRTGGRRVLSDNDTPSSAHPFGDPRAMAIDHDGSILVVDQVRDAILRIDPVTGARTVVAGTDVPRGSEPFGDPVGLALAPGGKLYVTDKATARIYIVDPATGARTKIKLFFFFTEVAGLLVRKDNSLVACDRHGFRLFHGTVGADRRFTGGVLSDRSTPGSEAAFDGPRSLAIAPDGAILVADGADGTGGSVFRVDPKTGARQLLLTSKSITPRGITVGLRGEVIVADREGRILELDPTGGAPRVISGLTLDRNGTVGSGPVFEMLMGVAVSPGTRAATEQTKPGSEK